MSYAVKGGKLTKRRKWQVGDVIFMPPNATEDDLRAAFGLSPDDPLPEITDATRNLALEIGPGASIENMKDAAGNIIGQRMTGASTNEIN